MTATYKQSDPATDCLLDFIAGGVPTNPSGESAGCYDATFGDIDGSHYGELAKKTLSQIYQMQSEMLAQNGISTATGRYQGLKSTIEEYQASKGLPNSAMFSEALQDDFGLAKLMDRGYSDWWAKAISDDEFMNKLSCEWASLPDPYNGGRSHYEGDSAGNSASTSLDNFRAALKQARQFIDQGAGHPDNVRPSPHPTAVITDTRLAIKMIQGVLLLTGDLADPEEVDGVWGPKSEAAMDQLINRS